MRSRWAILSAALMLAFMTVPQAMAASRGFVVAQAEDSSSETEGEQSGGGSGQSDPEAETGTEEAESAGGEETVEAGPPWTYQMARIIVVLSILLGLAIARWYWKLVGSRQRSA